MHIEPDVIAAEFKISIPIGERPNQTYTTFGTTITRKVPNSKDTVAELTKLFQEAGEVVAQQVAAFQRSTK